MEKFVLMCMPIFGCMYLHYLHIWLHVSTLSPVFGCMCLHYHPYLVACVYIITRIWLHVSTLSLYLVACIYIIAVFGCKYLHYHPYLVACIYIIAVFGCMYLYYHRIWLHVSIYMQPNTGDNVDTCNQIRVIM